MPHPQRGHQITVSEDASVVGIVRYACTRCDWFASYDGLQADLLKGVADLNLEPCPNCPTCGGSSRETTGLVCGTCGTDYGSGEPDGDLTEGETLGLQVAAAINQAQAMADQAQHALSVVSSRLAETAAHLTAMVDLATRQGTSWAKDDLALAAAASHLQTLEGVESNQSPEQEPTT